MKQVLLLLSAFLFTGALMSQTTILDFETAGTSTTYQYFGSSLDGTLNNIIANPDPSGINTSSMVADHVKPAGSEVWAGAFPNPALGTAADMTVNNQICIKVWAPAVGNVGIKLEGSATGPNWVRTADVSQAMTWTEVCIDVNLPSIEAPALPAFGNVYPTVTLFFDFGMSFSSDQIYYWDDLKTKTGATVTDGDITFSVDMNTYTGSFSTVYVSGGFNGWAADSNPLSDMDGDGVWTATVPNVPVGLQEYKFQVDSWADQEQFNGYETCVQVDPTGQFVNRKIVVTDDATLPTVCWNSCYECGDAVNITIELGSGVPVSSEGLFIAGGGNFGIPGDFPLKDDNGDGVYTITVERQKGFQSFYAFTNGACADYSCKENIAGQDCANPNNFNDRHMGPIMQDTTIATCFGVCSINTDCGGSGPGTVNFAVDMNNYTGSFTTAYVSGSFNGWSGDANPLSDSNGDGIWEASLSLQPGNYEYKFELDNWAISENFMDGDPCTITDPTGQFVNRAISVDGDATVCFEWETCNVCNALGAKDLVVDQELFSLSPTVATDFTTLFFNKNIREDKLVRVFSSTGQLIENAKISGNDHEYRLPIGQLATGIYLVYVQAGNRIATEKLVKQ